MSKINKGDTKMSGGALNYGYLKIDMLIEELQSELDENSGDMPDDIRSILVNALGMFRGASGAAKDIEWYLSGDTGEDDIRARHKKWPQAAALAAAKAEQNASWGTEMTTKHTPVDRPDLGHFFKDTVGRHDVALDGKPGERLTYKQVAIRMIHTWNCHDELVEALDNLLDAVCDIRGVDIEGCYAIEEIAKARAIIAKAKGK